MNGDYAQRRKKCPECSKPLSDMKDIYKDCAACGYKSYAVDLRSYILTFTKEELAHYDKEVFEVRRDQFHRATKAKSKSGVRKAAPATKCFLCSGCPTGKELGCPNYKVSQ